MPGCVRLENASRNFLAVPDAANSQRFASNMGEIAILDTSGKKLRYEDLKLGQEVLFVTGTSREEPVKIVSIGD